MILRELLLKLGLEVDEAKFAKGQIAASLIEAGAKAAVDAVKELATAFIENAKEAIEYGDHIKKTSQSIGVGVEALQELQYAAKLSDVDTGSLSISLGKLAMNMKKAKEGSKEAAASLKGIDYKNADGTLKTADETLSAIADKFKSMPDGVDKTALSMQLFGKAGKQMIPFLNDGAAGIEELREEAHSLGLVMGGDAVDASEKLNDDLERLHMIGQGLWRQAIGPLLPQLSILVKQFLAWRKANAAILAQRLQSVMSTLIGVVKFLGQAFSSVVLNAGRLRDLLSGGYGLQAAFIAIGAIAVVAGRQVMWAWIKAAAPFIALAAIIAGLYLVFDDIAGYYEGKDSVYGRFKQEMETWLKPQANDPWWLVALKDFMQLLHDAIEAKHEFDDAMNITNPKMIDKMAGRNSRETQAQSDRQTLATARQRAAMGLPVTDAARDALGRSGVSSEAFMAKYNTQSRPELTGGGGMSSGSASVSAPVQITVVQQPGQSGTDLASQIKTHIDDHLQSVYSEANAGVSQ